MEIALEWLQVPNAGTMPLSVLPHQPEDENFEQVAAENYKCYLNYPQRCY